MITFIAQAYSICKHTSRIAGNVLEFLFETFSGCMPPSQTQTHYTAVVHNFTHRQVAKVMTTGVAVAEHWEKGIFQLSLQENARRYPKETESYRKMQEPTATYSWLKL